MAERDPWEVGSAVGTADPSAGDEQDEVLDPWEKPSVKSEDEAEAPSPSTSEEKRKAAFLKGSASGLAGGVIAGVGTAQAGQEQMASPLTGGLPWYHPLRLLKRTDVSGMSTIGEHAINAYMKRKLEQQSPELPPFEPEIVSATRRVAEDPLRKQMLSANEAVQNWIGLTEEEKRSNWTQLGQMAGGFTPYIVAGKAALPLAAIESFQKHVSEDFEAKREELGDEDAAKFALKQGLKSGALNAALFHYIPKGVLKAMPPSVKEAIFLSGKLGKAARGTVGAASGGITLGGVTAGENVISGRPTMEGVPLSVVGGMIPGAVHGAFSKPPVRAVTPKTEEAHGKQAVEKHAAILPESAKAAGEELQMKLTPAWNETKEWKGLLARFSIPDKFRPGQTEMSISGRRLLSQPTEVQMELAKNAENLNAANLDQAIADATARVEKAKAKEAAKKRRAAAKPLPPSQESTEFRTVDTSSLAERNAAEEAAALARLNAAIEEQNKAKGGQGAVPVGSTTSVPVGETSGGSKEVGQGVSTSEASAGAQAGKGSGASTEAATSEVPLDRMSHEMTPEEQKQWEAQEEARKSKEEDERIERETREGLAMEAAKEAGQEMEAVDTITGRDASGAERPFAAAFLQAGGGNKIRVSWKAFHKWLENVPERLRPQAIKARIHEELVHNRVLNALGENVQEAVGSYWNRLSSWEKAINRRRYLGSGNWRRGQGENPVLMGHEAIRFQLQRASQMTPSEFAESALGERVTLETLTVLEDAIRFARENLLRSEGAKANRAQLDMLSKMMENVSAAKVAVSQGEGREKTDQPMATAREEEAPRGMVRLYHGEGGAEGGGLGGDWFSRDINRARGYGPNISFVDVPQDVYERGRAAIQQRGIAPVSDAVLPREFVQRARPVGQAVEPVVHDLDLPMANDPAKTKRYEPPIPEDKYPPLLRKTAFPVTVKRPDGSTYKAASDAVKWPNIPPGTSSTDVIHRVILDSEGKPWWSTGYLHEGESIVEEQNLPFARRRDRGKGQAELFLDPGGKPEQRKGAEELGALPVLSRKETKDKAVQILSGAITRTPITRKVMVDPETGKIVRKADAGPTATLQEKQFEHYTRPSYSEFEDWFKRNMGSSVGTEYARTIWEDAVWKEVLNAPTERLEQWRKALGVGPRLSEVGKMKGVAIPEVRPEEAPAGQMEMIPAPVGVRKKTGSYPTITDPIERRQILKQSQRRAQIQGEIAAALIEDSIPTESLGKTEVEFEDLNQSHPNLDPITDIDRSVLEKPESLSKLLASGARLSSKMAESLTARLVLLWDRSTNEAFLVSTYNDSGKTMVVDPKASGARPNVEMNADFLKKYRPVSTLLLKDPVRNFKQRFSSVKEFNDKVGNDARESSDPLAEAVREEERQGAQDDIANRTEDLLEQTGREDIDEQQLEGMMTHWEEQGDLPPLAEGTPGLKETGSVTGEHAELGRTAQGIGGSAVRTGRKLRRTPLQASEASAIFKLMSAWEIETPEDISDLLLRIENNVGKTIASGIQTKVKAAKGGGLVDPSLRGIRGYELKALLALDKIIASLERRYGKDLDWSGNPRAAIEQALAEIYEAYTNAKEISGQSPEIAFSKTALERYGEQARPPVKPAAKQAVNPPQTGTAGELSARMRNVEFLNPRLRRQMLWGAGIGVKPIEPVEGVSRELSMFSRPGSTGRVPPTVSRPSQLPPGLPPVPWRPAPPAPEGRAAAPIPGAEVFYPEEKATQLRGLGGLVPTTPSNIGGERFTFHEFGGREPGRTQGRPMFAGKPEQFEFERLRQEEGRTEISKDYQRQIDLWEAEDAKSKGKGITEAQRKAIELERLAGQLDMFQDKQRYEGGGKTQKADPRHTQIDLPLAVDRLKKKLAEGKEAVQGELARITSVTKTLLNRKEAKDVIYYTRDAADATAAIMGAHAGWDVKLASMDVAEQAQRANVEAKPYQLKKWTSLRKANREYKQQQKEALERREAAKAVIATGEVIRKTVLPTGAGTNVTHKYLWTPNRRALADLKAKTEEGIKSAKDLINKGDSMQKVVGMRWLKAAEKLKAEVEYAEAHWHEGLFQDTVRATRKAFHNQWDWERSQGITRTKDWNYVPGRYEGDVFDDNSVLFGGMSILGRNFRKPKIFKSYYHAIAEGPYIPVNYDVADLVNHRVRQGGLMASKNAWVNSMRQMKDPESGEPIIADPVKTSSGIAPPSLDYELLPLDNGRQIVAVRKGFSRDINNAIGESAIRKWPISRDALRFAQFLKHNGILIYDTFHPMRLGQYLFALTGTKGGYNAGWSALDMNPDQLKRVYNANGTVLREAPAVEKGIISKEQADWATGSIEVKMGSSGRTTKISRINLLNEMIRQGFNVGQHQDALYSEMKVHWPFLKEFNQHIFNRMTRGMMVEAAIRNFEKLQHKNPTASLEALSRDVVKDINIFFGSIGRQGWVKNPMISDLTQIIFLAPKWVEGLVQKEVRGMARVGGTAASKVGLAGSYRKGLPTMGALGMGMAKGLAYYFALTQAINLITRRQLTFQNDEEGHKLDAWIPIGDGQGMWVNPMSVFAELSHDMLRLLETKDKAWDAIDQIGRNKLGPWGRMGVVLSRQTTPTGEKLTSTPELLWEAGKQLTPVPITLGKPVQESLHWLYPKGVSIPVVGGAFEKPFPGSTERQGLASFTGIKATASESAGQRISKMANHFMRQNDYQQEGMEFTPTTQASGSKLRSALRIGDKEKAAHLMDELSKKVGDEQVYKSMEAYARRPFTGNRRHEAEFLGGLTPKERELYSQARYERIVDLQNFVQFYIYFYKAR